MEPRWVKRRAHTRQLPNGGFTYVRESWALQHLAPEGRKTRYRHECPHCGAEVISVNMPNGGWVHFEGAKGLHRIRHPCLHLGEGLSRKRDDITPDLFDMQPPNKVQL